ncbi:MAG: hypothetical protein DSY46_05420 [Hydrogenimonas sp.]|nr:MAG: hypothetical protein DSY46_05420 [Hydrogenimonas sp.]
MRWLMMVITILFMGGCAVKTVPTPTTYTLHQETPYLKNLRLQQAKFEALRLTLTHATRLSNTTAIYYQKSDFLQQPYTYSRWYDRLDSMFENKLMQALYTTNLAKSILPATTHADTPMTLEVVILNFVQDFSQGEPSIGRVVVMATLIDNHQGKTIASKRFSANIPAPSEDAQGGIVALNRATDRVIMEMVEWLEAL